MRLISAGSLVRAQSGPPARRAKVKEKRAESTSKIDNEFRLRLAGHKPGTEDNLRGKEVSEHEVLTSNCPAQQFFENYR